MTAPIVAAVIAALLASVALLLKRWYRTFDWDGEPDELTEVETADGWRLELARYRPVGPPRKHPVILSHGFAGRRLIFDLGDDCSLARAIAKAGFDVFCLDLRGRGRSQPLPAGSSDEDGPRHWSFDDFVAQDLPTAVAHVCQLTGATEAFWVGMEVSGQVLYAAAIEGTTQQVRGGITLGSPAVTPADAKVPGVTAAPKARRRGRIPFRAGARAAGPILAYTRSRQLDSSFRMGHTDPRPVARYLRNGVPDESARLADQFADWVRSGTMRSLDRTTTWSDRLNEIDLPLLVVAAAADLQRPASSIEATARALGGSDVTFLRAGVDDGFSVDFGHDDLLVCTAAVNEVYPRIVRWLIDHG